jgi:hypothetical protein
VIRKTFHSSPITYHLWQKSIFAVYGILRLAVILCYILNFSWARWAMLLAAAGSLWYLWAGTIFGTIQIVLLLLLKAQEISD